MDSKDSNLPQPQRITNKRKGKEKMDYSTTSDHETNKRLIAQFFYENNIPPYAVKSRSFKNLLDLGGKGELLEQCIPTIKEFRGRILHNEVKDIDEHVENTKQLCKFTGCSIILDGWDDKNGRKFMNVLVDCPFEVVSLGSIQVPTRFEQYDKFAETIDRVIDEIGSHNVLQIISYTASAPWLDHVRDQIKEKHITIFWSVSVTHCLTLMLEKVASSINWVKDTIAKAKKVTRIIYNNKSLLRLMAKTNNQSHNGHALVVPSKIRVARIFLTLEKMYMRKDDVKAIFSSREWVESYIGSSSSGKDVSTLVRDDGDSFWKDLSDLVHSSMPIVNGLSLFNNANNNNEAPHMGIIYETMDQMKEEISKRIKRERAREIWGVIDDIWNNVLHSPLHAAGYYLNPKICHAKDFKADSEVTEGLLSTILKLGGCETSKHLISQQLKLYGQGSGYFEKGISKNMEKIIPVEWWVQYGKECPELQSLAIKILGMTCNGASTYELRRDVAERFLSLKETHPSFNWLRDFAYVSHNLQLKPVKEKGFKFEIIDQEIHSSDDWICG